MMMAGCIGMVLYFKESSNMEAAFGLSVTLTMLMTTVLLSYYLYTKRYPKIFMYAVLVVFLWIEVTFLIANMKKFTHGGWLTLLIGLLLITTMYVWQAGRALKNKYKKFLRLDKFIPSITQLSNDSEIPKFATHLVYLTLAEKPGAVEQKIIESIFCRQPKRAEVYWLVHVDVDDAPYTMSYTTEVLAPQDLIYVRFKLGFRVVPRINLFFEEIVSKMVANKEVVIDHSYCMITEHGNCGDFKFVVMKSFLSFENQLPFWKNLMMSIYFMIDKISIPDAEAFGLDYNNVVIERVPVVMQQATEIRLKRENE
jgi:KUP system potassium uptake protein